MSLFFKKRRIRVDILTIFLTLFMSSISMIIYYSYTLNSNAILKIAEQLIERTNESIIERLNHFLKPNALVNIVKFYLKDKTLEQFEMKALSAYMHIILESYPQLNNVYIADVKGNMFVENQILKNTTSRNYFPFYEKLHVPTGTKFFSEEVRANHPQAKIVVTYRNENGELISKERFNYNYDPRLRPWYLGANQSKTSQWVGKYHNIGTQINVISIAFLIDINGQLEGVAAVDLRIDSIKQELKQFTATDYSLVFIINNVGDIITTSNDIKKHKIDHGNDVIDNKIIQIAYERYHRDKINHFMFYYENTRYIAHFTPFALANNEDWEIATIIPVETFVSSIDKANQQILIVSIILAIVGIGLIFISAHAISNPIICLADETKEMINLNFDRKIGVKSNIYEIQVLSDALITVRSVLSSFVKYVPKVLVMQLIKSKLIAQLGGKKRNITLLFSDINNFTSIVDQTHPEFLTLHLSEYFNALTKIIHSHAGNIDKYIGDAIMAFWGAPLADSEQVKHACLAVLACRDEVCRLNKLWDENGMPVFSTRFALHAGPAVVGNVGSSDRLNYTAMGYSVNVAARLVDINKVYNTEILVTESIYIQCKNDFEFKMLDAIQLRGIKNPVLVYELIRKMDSP